MGRERIRRSGRRAAAAGLLLAGLLAPAAAHGQVVRPPFDASYSVEDLGVPPGVTGSPYRGLALKPGSSDRLLVAVGALSPVVQELGLTRDGAGRITGFSSAATHFAGAPLLNGGPAGGPGGVLFLPRSDSKLAQIRPGSSTADKLVTLTRSFSELTFVPPELPGAGSLKLIDASRNW
jgi:hypothetical protein